MDMYTGFWSNIYRRLLRSAGYTRLVSSSSSELGRRRRRRIIRIRRKSTSSSSSATATDVSRSADSNPGSGRGRGRVRRGGWAVRMPTRVKILSPLRVLRSVKQAYEKAMMNLASKRSIFSGAGAVPGMIQYSSTAIAGLAGSGSGSGSGSGAMISRYMDYLREAGRWEPGSEAPTIFA